MRMTWALGENQVQAFQKIENLNQLPHYRNPIGTSSLDMK